MNINRELAGLLGLCWHPGGVWYDGKQYICEKCKQSVDENATNIDFISDPGKLLRLMMKHLSEKDFREFNSVISCCESAGVCILTDYITDTTGLLAQAAREWLTAQKEGV
jgi:hypothetical protein